MQARRTVLLKRSWKSGIVFLLHVRIHTYKGTGPLKHIRHVFCKRARAMCASMSICTLTSPYTFIMSVCVMVDNLKRCDSVIKKTMSWNGRRLQTPLEHARALKIAVDVRAEHPDTVHIAFPMNLTCVRLHKYANTHAHAHTHTRTQTNARMHAHAHALIHTHAHTHTHTHLHTLSLAYTHACAHTHTHTCTPRTHKHTHIHKDTHTHKQTYTHAHRHTDT